MNKGHGEIVIHQNEDGSVQLRDNLSRFWCACGQPAIKYHPKEAAPHDFLCDKHEAEYKEGESA